LALDNARRRISGIKTDCREVFGDSYSCLSVRVLSGPGRPSQQRPRYREHSVLTIQPFETLATPEMFIYRLRNRLAAAQYYPPHLTPRCESLFRVLGLEMLRNTVGGLAFGVKERDP
jgi:hypothetical protein